jgi:acyl dehydratase
VSANVIHLSESPNTLGLYARAAKASLPVIGNSGSSLPNTVVELAGVKIDTENLAAYCSVTGLRLSDSLPLTYPFTLTFPLAMALFVSPGYPYPAIGLVHTDNVIEQFRPISVSEPLDLSVRAENLREHRKGMLADIVAEARVGRELVWRCVSTFLRPMRTSLSGGPKGVPNAPSDLPAPLRVLKVDQKTISRYAAVAGDRNPIHVSKLGAKAFGFPTTIAHGMWTAAAVLGSVEGRIPDAVTYTVRFGKPVFLPAKLNVYADAVDGGWDLAVRNPKKGYPHLTGTLRAGA